MRDMHTKFPTALFSTAQGQDAQKARRRMNQEDVCRLLEKLPTASQYEELDSKQRSTGCPRTPTMEKMMGKSGRAMSKKKKIA